VAEVFGNYEILIKALILDSDWHIWSSISRKS